MKSRGISLDLSPRQKVAATGRCRVRLLALLVSSLFAACQPKGPAPGVDAAVDASSSPDSLQSSWLATMPEGDPGLVLAEDRLGPLTWGEVDALARRQEKDLLWTAEDTESRYRWLIRSAASERLLLEEAKLVGAERDPAFERSARRIERQAYTDTYLDRLDAPRLTGRQGLQQLRQAAAGLPEAKEARRMSRANVRRVIEEGRSGVPVFQLGEFVLTAGELIDQTRQLAVELEDQPTLGLVLRWLDEVQSREILYQHLLADARFEAPREAIEHARRQKLVESFTERKLEVWLDRRPEQVRTHYQNHRERFSTPPRLDVTRLEVPGGEDPAARRARIEAAIPELDAGRLALAALAAELDGELTTLSAMTPRRLAAQDPSARRAVTRLQPGEHSPPYASGNGWVLLRVDARQEPKAHPLRLVHRQVVRHLIASQRPELVRQLREELLAEAGFRMLEQNLERLTQ